ncbi:MAG TPA: hypothetical protein PKL84_07660, partial [Candidatus Hydrogenedentes bacterium]|nr:hypothetical protein [Candidatus Hydrogenedentota bacterium]
LGHERWLRNIAVALGNARLFGLAREDVLAAMEEAGIDHGRRPQTLDLDEFRRITSALQARLC